MSEPFAAGDLIMCKHHVGVVLDHNPAQNNNAYGKAIMCPVVQVLWMTSVISMVFQAWLTKIS